MMGDEDGLSFETFDLFNGPCNLLWINLDAPPPRINHIDKLMVVDASIDTDELDSR